MGIFDVDEKKLRALYHRAWLECGRGFVYSRKFDYLDHALTQATAGVQIVCYGYHVEADSIRITSVVGDTERFANMR